MLALVSCNLDPSVEKSLDSKAVYNELTKEIEMKEAEMYKVTTITRDGKSIVAYVTPERRVSYARAMREEYGSSVTVESASLEEVQAMEETNI